MKILSIAVSVIIIAILAFATVKKVSPVGWGWWGSTNTSSGIALHGHDPISYFDGGSPVLGSAEFTFEWGDATWQFASAEHRELFAENPEQYSPQFGSFCAFAVSKGFTADPDPEAWHIEDGKLYVFADQNVRDDWVMTIAEGSLQRSRENWAKRNQK